MLVCRLGDMGKTGHLCTPLIPAKATQGSVFANGIPVNRMGDPAFPHLIKFGKFCVGHGAMINQGSPTVFAEGIPIARVGDSFDFGAMVQGSPNVMAGGGSVGASPDAGVLSGGGL